MTEKEIITQGTQIISEFIRRVSTEFHTNWIHLMEVVERIESLKSPSSGRWVVNIHSNGCTIQDTKFRSDAAPYWYFNDCYAPTKIEATWEAVVDFINYYNKNEKTNNSQ